MGWLREVLNQAAGVLRSMTPVQRATAAMLVVTVAVVLGLAGWLGGRTSRVPVVHGSGMPPEHLGRIQTELEREGIDAAIENGNVLVPRSQIDKAYFLLKRRRLVKDREISALAEAIAKMGITDTNLMQRSRLKEAEERDLERIIETIEGVDEAMVKIMERGRTRFGLRGPEPVGVAVSVAPALGGEIDQLLANTIISMTHVAVLQSSEARIIVTDASTGIEFRKRTDLTVVARGEDRFELNEKIAQRLAAKLELFLRKAGYPPNVIVNVKLNLEKTVKLITKTYDPTGKGPIDIYKVKKTIDTVGREVGGPVGTPPNTGFLVEEGNAGGTVKPETNKIKEEEIRSVVDTVYKHVVDTPGEIAEVRISCILTPRIVEVKDPETGEIKKIWVPTDTPAAQKELEDWRRLIANVSGAKPEKVELAWRSSAFLSPEPARARKGAEFVVYFERYGPMAVVSFLAMLALFFLYGLGRRAAHPPPAPIVVESRGEEGMVDGEPSEPEELKLREMQSRLKLMTTQHPRKVASLVKRWMVREG